MDEREFKAINDRLERMSARVDRVLAKESLGKPMPILDFKPRPQLERKPEPARDIPRDIPTAQSAQMTGTNRGYSANEARLWDLNGRAWPSRAERCDCPKPSEPGITDVIFDQFERDFDEMASRWRA